MAIRFSSGTGNLIDKDLNKPLSIIQYNLLETSPTKYTSGKWWGEISIKKELKKTGNFIMEMEDGRKGECVISGDNQNKGTASNYFYSFFGRGKLGKAKYGP